MERKLVNIVELSHVVSILERYASRLIVNKAIATAGLDRKMLQNASAFFPYSAEAILIETIARAIGDRHLGARVGRHFEYSNYGAYSAYVLGAPDLASALDRGKRALFVTHPGSEIVLRETENHLVVGRNSKGLSVIGHHHLDEGALFVIGHVAKHFLGADWKPDWVEITNTSARDIADLANLTGTTIRSNAFMPGIAIRKTDLITGNPGPPIPERTITLNELGSLMGVSPQQTMEEAVVQMLAITLATRKTDQTSVARLLAIGPRSLQRALKKEGTSFRELRSHVVAERAKAYLTNTCLPLVEVAKILGFTDPRSFRRAFKEATGLSPTNYRSANKEVQHKL